MTQTGEARDRLSEQAYKALAPNSPLGLLEEALKLSEQFAPMEQKLRQARKEGLIASEYLGHQIDEAERAEVINKADAEALRDYHRKVLHLLSVDDFAPDEIGRKPAPRQTEQKTSDASTNKKKATRKTAQKTAARKKTRKKKTAS